MVYTEVLGLLHESHGLVECGPQDRLTEALGEVRRLIAGTYLAYFECEVRYIEAYAALKVGPHAAARAALERAVRHSQASDYHHPNQLRFSVALPAVLAACLEAGIETGYARSVIRRHRLRPPSTDIANWPWVVSVRTLGGFEVQLDGAPLRFAGKAPRKPLALLKAIIAFGGVEVPHAKLIDALWPGDEGDAGKQALGVTLVRLRKLLGRTTWFRSRTSG